MASQVSCYSANMTGNSSSSSSPGNQSTTINNSIVATVLKDSKPLYPFSTMEEYLVAMREDLAEWLQQMYPHLDINYGNFFEKLWTGVALCKHANAVKAQAIEYIRKKEEQKIMKSTTSAAMTTSTNQQHGLLLSKLTVKYFESAKPGTFYARDNVHNFIDWCRNQLKILECLLFETDDLIMQKNEKNFILCLLEVARRGAKFGMPAPMLVQMERQIDREIAQDQKIQFGAATTAYFDDDEDEDDLEEEGEKILQYGPQPQIVTNDLKSLDEMVRDLVAQCTCPTQFPMIRLSEGKYKIGDTKTVIFVRILRSHVMVRVGGGWDTLSHYLDKHDPCRCRSQHRPTTQSARLVMRNPEGGDLHGSHVYYERNVERDGKVNGVGAGGGSAGSGGLLGPPMNSLNRSRSKSPSAMMKKGRTPSPLPKKYLAAPVASRSRSPTPFYTSTAKLVPKKSKEEKHVTTVHLPIKPQSSLETDGSGDETTSEVSDEGYRSLGLVIPPPPPPPPPKMNLTWNGRQKSPRKSLTSETFKPVTTSPKKMVRNGLGRRSVSSLEAGSTGGRGKQPNLKEEVENLLLKQKKQSSDDDDLEFVRSLQKMMKKYKLDGGDVADEGGEGEFRRRGSVRGSPRKDSRSASFTRIPAPTYFN